MKWLFSLLVLANIALLIWGVLRERVVPDVSMQESASIGEMRLLSESRGTEVQPPVEGMASETTEAPEKEELPLASQESEPAQMEQAGNDTLGEAAVDPVQAVEQPETEVGEGSVESRQTAQVENLPADEPMEVTTATETQERLEDPGVDQLPVASTESEPASESETSPEAIASEVSAQEGQSPDSPESAAEVEEDIVEPVPTEEVPVEEVQYCGTVGPLEEEKDANSLLETLAEREMAAVIRKESVQKASGFWVIIPPFATVQEARVEENRLASASVKDYRRFYRGEFKNGISLGIYSRRRNADIRKAAIEAKGFSPEVVPRTRRITEFWLDYKATPANKADNQDWLAENYPKLGFKDQSCSLIATP
jgi:hypothetical protein